MKKKISILTLVFVFLVSTTGMPLIIHYCKMMETASLQACEMHNKEVKKSSCCELDSDTKSFPGSYFSKAIDDCCEDFVVDHSVKETFLSSKTEINIPIYLYTFTPVNFGLTSNHNSYIKLDIYPPTIHGNKIYLTNSILII